MVDRKKLGKKSRNKGKRGERQVASMLTERGFEARRGVQFKGGLNSPDVICDDLYWAQCEVKYVESLNIYKAMNQAKHDCQGSKVPLVFHKKNNRELLVTMTFFDWINLTQWACNKLDNVNTLDLGLFYDGLEEAGNDNQGEEETGEEEDCTNYL